VENTISEVGNDVAYNGFFEILIVPFPIGKL